MATAIPHAYTRRFLWAGYLIGFALGGFFDGILLHQILQWHHLLSGLEAASLRDLRAQVLADGLFHGLMYLIAAAGLVMLYRSRQEFTGVRRDRALLAHVLVGFGVWHIVDTLLSHWLTGIHRTRMDVPDPLAWDLFWLVAFGGIPLAIGGLLKRRYPQKATLADRRGSARGLALGLATATLLAAAASLLPPAGAQATPSVTVVLRPDVRPAAFLRSLADSEARILWSDRAGGVWVISAKDLSSMHHYRHGALYVSGSVLPAGCFAWIKA